MPQEAGTTIQNIWNVTPGHKDEPGVVYAGTQPAGLFRSEDNGHNWSSVDALTLHPERGTWSGTGGGDSCMHSVTVDPRDPKHIYACISAGGSFVSKDRGETWNIFTHRLIPEMEKSRTFLTTINEQFGADAPPLPADVDPLAINEMHKMVLDEKQPDVLWTQTHFGVFRSDNDGQTWKDRTFGLPSFHGFPIAVSKRAPDSIYVVPLEMEGTTDNFRVCPGQFTVYRSRDDGASWEGLTKGLPGPNDYQSVYREGLATDGLDTEGVYVGTSNGEIWGSRNGGDEWFRLPGTYPPILSIGCAVV
jgi:hypothetical protein